MGEKLLQMNGKLIAHFVYSAFEGFSLETCFRMFRDNCATKDLMFVNRSRELNQPGEGLINYQRRTYEYWSNGGKMRR